VVLFGPVWPSVPGTGAVTWNAVKVKRGCSAGRVSGGYTRASTLPWCSTANTPGSASARAMSMRLMRACG
jgi:hypothetical protein